MVDAVTQGLANTEYGHAHGRCLPPVRPGNPGEGLAPEIMTLDQVPFGGGQTFQTFGQVIELRSGTVTGDRREGGTFIEVQQVVVKDEPFAPLLLAIGENLVFRK